MMCRLSYVLTLAIGLAACGDDVGGADTDSGPTATGSETGGEVVACGDLLSSEDLTACSPTPLDYRPGQDDGWAVCLTDDGAYPLIGDTPSSIARVAAYEAMRALLDGGVVPTPDDFTDARVIYAQDEGLESRLQRREDLRFPSIPESAWDPGVDGDKQCTVSANVAAFPDRCAGPAQIAPLINEAFAAGQLGQGNAFLHAARIDAGLTWFLMLSVLKEANTCFTSKARDCDSAWAYYTGGFDRDGGIGLSGKIRALDATAHQAIWDGFAAFRCLREAAPADETPAVADLAVEDQGRLCAAQTQLETALTYGLAVEIRAAVLRQAQLTGDEEEAGWEYARILAQVLDVEAERRDASAASELRAALAAQDDAGTLAALDAVFVCP